MLAIKFRRGERVFETRERVRNESFLLDRRTYCLRKLDFEIGRMGMYVGEEDGRVIPPLPWTGKVPGRETPTGSRVDRTEKTFDWNRRRVREDVLEVKEISWE